MAEGKKSFILYSDIQHTVKKLTDEKAGQLFKHLLAYVNDEHPTTDDIVIEIAFEPIKQSLKRDLVKYEEIREKKRLAGIASAESKKQQKQQQSTPVDTCQQDTTYSTVNDNDNVNDSVIKIKYIYSQFYDEELQRSNNDQNYLKFIKFLFGENELSRPLTAVLKLKDQMKYDQFLKLREQSIKFNVNIYPTILNLENSKRCKDYSVLYTTLKNWITPKK